MFQMHFVNWIKIPVNEVKVRNPPVCDGREKNKVEKRSVENKMMKFFSTFYCKAFEEVMLIHSQTCVQWPPLGPPKSGRCWRWSLYRGHLNQRFSTQIDPRPVFYHKWVAEKKQSCLIYYNLPLSIKKDLSMHWCTWFWWL